MDFARIIRHSGTVFGDRAAVCFDDRTQTYAELYERACRLAHGMRSLGAVPGDRIAVLGDNSAQTVEQVAACALGGFPRATLYTYHSAEINRYLLELIGARLLIVDAELYPGMAALVEDLPDLAGVIVDGATPPSDGAIDYEELVAGSSNADPAVPVDDDDVHVIRFSSGTTGRPKGIYHTSGRWIAYNSEYRWVTPEIDERDRYLAPGSLAHLCIAFLWQMLAVGATIVPMRKFDARLVLELIERHGITYTAMVPAMIQAVIVEAEGEKPDLSSLRCLLYAGSPIADTTLDRAQALFGDVLHQLYAQSEVSPITMLRPRDHRHPRHRRSAGRATPNVDLSVRDDDGNRLPAGQIGEIAARSPGSMSGIWGRPEALAERLTDDGAVLTRDMGYLDEDGFLYLVDRKDDMIVSGGYNIWPAELEEVLSEHPGVAEVCVVGAPHERWGETPVAVVVPSEEGAVDEDQLIEMTRAKAGPTKKVTRVEFATSLPRSGAGKVLRREVRERYWADLGARIAGS